MEGWVLVVVAVAAVEESLAEALAQVRELAQAQVQAQEVAEAAWAVVVAALARGWARECGRVAEGPAVVQA